MKEYKGNMCRNLHGTSNLIYSYASWQDEKYTCCSDYTQTTKCCLQNKLRDNSSFTPWYSQSSDEKSVQCANKNHIYLKALNLPPIQISVIWTSNDGLLSTHKGSVCKLIFFKHRQTAYEAKEWIYNFQDHQLPAWSFSVQQSLSHQSLNTRPRAKW